MPIVIDRTTSDNYYISDFDTTFINFLCTYLQDVTFTDTSKHLIKGAQSANTGDQVFIDNIDVFNALAISKDLDLLVTPELLQTYDSNYWRILFYTINVDYNPLSQKQHAQQFMNVLINMWEGLNSPDDTQYIIGMKFADWQYFTMPSPVNCILWTKPSAKKVNTDKANYLRQSLDFLFMLMIDPNIIICGDAP